MSETRDKNMIAAYVACYHSNGCHGCPYINNQDKCDSFQDSNSLPLFVSATKNRIAELEYKLKTVCEWAAKLHPMDVECCNSCSSAMKNIRESPCSDCHPSVNMYKRHPALVIADEVTG